MAKLGYFFSTNQLIHLSEALYNVMVRPFLWQFLQSSCLVEVVFRECSGDLHEGCKVRKLSSLAYVPYCGKLGNGQVC